MIFESWLPMDSEICRKGNCSARPSAGRLPAVVSIFANVEMRYGIADEHGLADQSPSPSRSRPNPNLPATQLGCDGSKPLPCQSAPQVAQLPRDDCNRPHKLR